VVFFDSADSFIVRLAIISRCTANIVTALLADWLIGWFMPLSGCLTAWKHVKCAFLDFSKQLIVQML
jgi:hypothetical protein